MGDDRVPSEAIDEAVPTRERARTVGRKPAPRLWTSGPSAKPIAALKLRVSLAHIRAGNAVAHGDQGGAAKWTHAAMALAIRTLG